MTDHDQRGSRTEASVLPVGTVLGGRYRVEGAIGAGGMGEVHRAHDTRLGRDVAIKVLSPDHATNPSVQRRFEREMRAVAAFSHPNVMEIHDIGEHGGARFAVMELVEGRELRALIQQGLPVEQAIKIAAGVASALAAAHQHGLMHRDIKPENVMVSADGHVKVLDFGLARLQEPAADQVVTQAAMALGTIPYMSPEQANGKSLDSATDVFSLGTVLFEMLAGTNPFLGPSVLESLQRVVDADVPSLQEACPDAPAALRSLVVRMHRTDPAARPTAKDVASELRALGTETGAHPLASSPSTVTEEAEQVPTTRYARCDDIHIAYQVFGEGPVNLLIVPGFISNVDNSWACSESSSWLRTLGSFARVAVFDKRGTGLSDRVDDLPTMEQRVEDVCTVMDAAGFESAAVLGISEGGSLACVFAATYPQRCLALVLHGSFAKFESWFATEAELEHLFDYIRTGWGTGTSLPGFAPSIASDEAFQAWWGKFERLGANPGAAIALMRMNSEIDVSHVLPSIQSPALIIHREEDVLIDPSASAYLAKNIPETRMHTSPGSDHIPWVSDAVPAELDAVREFLHGLPDLETCKSALATVLAIRIAPSSGTTGVERATLARIQELLEAHEGSSMTAHPKAYVSTLAGPARAIRCAKAIAASTAKTSFCVHSGEIILTDTSIRGAAVDIAADIAAQAAPGEILATQIVKDLVAGSGLELSEVDGLYRARS